MSARDTTVLVHQVVDAIWGRGELDLADQLFAPDYINHGGLIPDLVHGPEAIKVAVALYRLAFPKLRIVVDELVAAGEMVTVGWTAHTAGADGLVSEADVTKPGTLTGSTVVHVCRGQIDESWMSWDAEGALQRFGLDRMGEEPRPRFAA